jgi:hypothetical protein
MELRLPLFGLARTTADWAWDTAITLAAVPGRVLDLLGSVESLVGRIDDVVARADELVRRTALVVDEVESVVGDARRVSRAAEVVVVDAAVVAGKADDVVTTAGQTARIANELVALYEPLARQAVPLLRRFVEELSPHEVEAAIKLVDQLPALTEHMINDVLPILGTLDKVGPDVHQLLEVTNDVRQAILGIPGFAFLRRRGEEKADTEG